jgi:hypothetical protein
MSLGLLTHPAGAVAVLRAATLDLVLFAGPA